MEKPAPISIQDLRMLDWYAGFALIGASPMASPKEAARQAWDLAEAMMQERQFRLDE